MKNKTTFIFSGQGSQYIGMNQLTAKNQISNDYFSRSIKILDYDICDIIENGPIDRLNKTLYTQPAIFIQSVIYDKILKNMGIRPNSVAGHSLGEFSALVSSKVISFEDALEIIKVRSKEMHISGKKNPGMMAAIIGANIEQINTICKQDNIVVAANYNSENQTVISGSINGVKNAIISAKEIGIRKCIPLNVSGAFHSPLMQDARIALEKVINSINFNNARVPVYQNVNPIPIMDSEEIKNNIIKQLVNPVRWNETIVNMYKDKHNNFIEVGPGKVLYNLNKKIIKNPFINQNSESIIVES
tara:strand:- start:375 stop:1280 length:906 start_codon:yes stop_codon:yes gene_type:complete